ncbi:phosphatidylinositol-specific phospholipase C domain-containing protein [Streptomyces goshikiensis]|uniref:phosphatidylinositol-specific phospholipase C domain-containing protein n=1 Tax=Streptomyces goshikiensis TaxID=1942 RepID=UPI002ADFE3B7|nr:phosphatidylinositol-specific phospholipase C domain-containing protein [Streptomyces goshikiensis]
MSEMPVEVEDKKDAPELFEGEETGSSWHGDIPRLPERPQEELEAASAEAGQLTSLSDWMAGIPDAVKLSDMSIPGTHESCALHEEWSFGYAKCQDWGLASQFSAGVRFVDIRCRVVGSGDKRSFAVHHGEVYQEMMFGDAVQQCWDFLRAHPRETVLMRLSQAKSQVSADEFRWVFENSYAGSLSRFHRGTTIPTLGEVRGKIVLMTQGPYIGGLNLGSGTLFDTQDVWERPTVQAKKLLVGSHLAKAVNAGASRSKIFMNYTSANSGPQYGITPRDYARELNPFTLSEINGKPSDKRTGVIAMDFVSSAATGAIVRMNQQPSNDIGLLTHTGSAWSAPALPWPGSKTPDAPALAPLGGKLYCAVRGLGNQIYISRLEAGKWSGFVRVASLLTHHAPALTAFNGKLYLAYTGTNANEPNILSSADGTTWSSQTRLPGRADTGPALAVRDNVLHCAYGASGEIWYNWSTNSAATSWTKSYQVPGAGTAHAPALATHQGKLYLAYRRTLSGKITIHTNTSSGWGASIDLPGTTLSTPALGVRGTTLNCVVRGGDDKLWHSSLNGTSWSSFQKINETTTTLSGPAIAAPDANNLYLVYRSA